MSENIDFDFEKIIINFNIIKKTIKKSMDEILFKYGLNFMDMMHIMTLYKNNEPLYLNDFIEIIGVDKATTTRTVNDLLNKAYVEKLTNNIRKFKIKLTNEGLKVAKHFYKEKKFIINRIFYEFNEKDKNNLIVLMEKMIKGIEKENYEKNI